MATNFRIKQYTRFENYYLALKQIQDKSLRAAFSLAIDEYMFEGAEPQFEPGTQEYFLWQMILPSLKTSLRQTFNGQKSKGKGTGPRPSMNGNQNARKQNEETESKTLTPKVFVEAWNEVTENKSIVSISDRNFQHLRNDWNEIQTMSKFKEIVKRASRDHIFEGHSDYFGYLFNGECRYRKYL